MRNDASILRSNASENTICNKYIITFYYYHYLFSPHKIFGVVALFLFDYKKMINGKDAREEIEGKSSKVNWGKVRLTNGI